jgi:hypothetical protein
MTVPVKVPMTVPVKALMTAPVKVPMTVPVKALMTAPVKVPVTAPVKAPLTVRANELTRVLVPNRSLAILQFDICILHFELAGLARLPRSPNRTTAAALGLTPAVQAIS